ncbi:MAG: UDP-N-acetylmuramate dehydrogenase [Clostridia bacterium]|jgi:UDP-N-acetylmuramate dehydrogenase|nr:UDP-N-acetylmuramate dehydrogenase [Clostridia bacterium]
MKKYDRLIAVGAEICYNYSAKNLSTFKSGGTFDRLIYPTRSDTLGEVVDILKDGGFKVLGMGSNTLVSDYGVEEDTLSLVRLNDHKVMKDGIYADAGLNMIVLSKIARDNGFTGLEFMTGIPGSVGGGIFMNAGAYESEIKDVIEYADVIKDGKPVRLTRDEIPFSYRNSGFKDEVIVGAKFSLKEGNPIIISSRMKNYATHRRERQPNLPSLGSVFKKVGDIGAGYYIEQAGLKGVRIGGAEVSQKHANFIVNVANATSGDFVSLVTLIENSVYEKFGVKLEREVRYIGRGLENI